MDLLTAVRWSWMNVLTKKRADVLIERFGSLDKALQNIDEPLLRELGCREETAIGALNRLEELDPKAYQQELRKRDLHLITIDDDIYPQSLRTIDDPPVFLYYRGDVSILNQPCIALVGTRDMSSYGKRIVEEFVPPLVRAGVITVSGLAYGIDAEVARQTVLAGGRTVAVLGHGLAQIHPKANEQLAKRIIETGGLILSEYALDVPADTYTFPARNRIIAGLALGTVVIEATEDSGSLITAGLALDYNRDVFAAAGQIFDPNFGGCHALLRKGTAKLVTSANHILEEFGMIARQAGASAESFASDNPDECAIYTALTSMPKALDTIVVDSKLSAAVANATLTVLELRGVAKNVGAGKWVRA